MSETEEEFPAIPFEEVEAVGIKAWPDPDTRGVLEGCPRIKEFREDRFACDVNQREQRLTVMSVLVHLDDGKERIHAMLRGKEGYNQEEVDVEIQESLVLGPRTCRRFHDVFDNACYHDCVHWIKQDISSPIRIESDKFIKTEGTGYWVVKTDKQGNPIPVKPCYDDLYKSYERDHTHISNSDTGQTHLYIDNRWKMINELDIKGFVQEKMNPNPKENHRKEFNYLIKCTNLKRSEWFNESTEGMINLKDGVYDIQNDKVFPHSKLYGFRYVLPYSFDKGAECSRFDLFMKEITCDKEDVALVLEEYMGYALANGPCLTEKALILYGSGANGKSTFMDILKALAGRDNYSSLSLTALNKDTKRYMVDGKLFNIGEETNVRALGDSEVFKTMVTGGEIDVKKLYSQDYIIKNRCKLIMACNELPKSSDRSDGLYRRMIFIPFTAKFTGSVRDPEIKSKLIKELPGIFNRAVEGYKRLKENNWRFSDSTSLAEALEDYKYENDNVLQWLTDRCEWTGEKGDYVCKDQMYKDYTEFCNHTGNYAITKISFFKSLKEKLPDYSEIKRVSFGGVRKRAIPGLIMGDHVGALAE